MNLTVTETPGFAPWPKMARIAREAIITEKIDGTNAQICITLDGQFLTGSRSRWITPGDDNFGFSKWAHDNKEELMLLGPGRHYGEWWGHGIQRGYGCSKGERYFSLFNAQRWVKGPVELAEGKNCAPNCCEVVPIIHQAEFDTVACKAAIKFLKENGSAAMPGYMNPEGIVVFHSAANIGFKMTCENDEKPKSEVAVKEAA
jgi:hypothetical protein